MEVFRVTNLLPLRRKSILRIFVFFLLDFTGFFYSFYVQPVSQWTSTHVVEWMAALNLYRYAELFRSKDIKGLDLLSLDKDKLTVIIFRKYANYYDKSFFFFNDNLGAFRRSSLVGGSHSLRRKR